MVDIVFVVAGKELRQRLRDRSAFIVGFGAPLLLAAIISLAIGGSFTRFHATFAVADEDHGPLAAAFVSAMHAPAVARIADFRTATSSADARRLARKDVDAAFVIPAGFSDAVTTGQAATLDVIRNRASLLGGQVGESLAQGFASRVSAAQLAVRTALASGAAADPVALGQRAAALPPAVPLTDALSGGQTLKPAAYFGPAMALFFVFFTVGLGARSLLAERASGTLGRLRAAPISGAAVLTGKAVATFAMGLASMLTLLVASAVLLGAHWSHPAAVLALTAAVVLAAMGIVTLVMSLARTEEQAGAYASAVAVLLALLGGSFVPISFAPPLLRELALLTPNGWALHAFTDLATGTRTLSTVVTAVVVCLGFAFVTGGIGLYRSAAVMAE
jgi:ABC-2 type transport system permease protein